MVESQWEEPFPPEGSPGVRRRYRIVEEGFRGRSSHGQLQARFLETGHGEIRRRSRPQFNPLPADASLGPVSRSSMVPIRGGEASLVVFERRPPPPSIRSSGIPHDMKVSERSLGLVSDSQIGFQEREDDFQERHYVGNRGKRKVESAGLEDEEFQENYYVGNKGKRKIFDGGNSHSQYVEWNSKKRPQQKTSALGRIQSGISVWNRIEEKPSFFSHDPSPPPHFSSPRFSDEKEQDIGTLDLSYKSNNLVAKVVVSSSPDELSSDGKGSNVVTTKTNAVKKKKVVKREKVITVVSGSGSIKGVPKKHTLSHTNKVQSHSDVSEKAVVLSNKPVSGPNSQPCPKKVKKVVSVNKTAAAKKPVKTVVSKIGSITKNHLGEDKVVEHKPTDGTSSRCHQQEPTIAMTNSVEQSSRAEGRITEDQKGKDEVIKSRPIDDISLQFCQQESTLAMTSIDNNNAEQSTRYTNLVQDVVIDDVKEEVSMMLSRKVGEKFSSPMVPDNGLVSDANSQYLAQMGIGIVKPLENYAVEGSSEAVVLGDAVIPMEQSQQMTVVVDDDVNSAHSDAELATSSFNKESSSLGLVVDPQAVISAGVMASFNEGGSFKDDIAIKGRERLEKQQRELEVASVTEQFETLAEGKNEPDDILLHPNMHNKTALLTSKTSDTITDHSLLDGPSDKEDYALKLSGRSGLGQSDCLRVRENSLMFPMADSVSVKQSSPFIGSGEDSSLDKREVQDAVHFEDAEQSYLQLSDSKNYGDNNHCNNQDEKVASKSNSLLVSEKLLASQAEQIVKSDKVVLRQYPLSEKTKQPPSYGPKKEIIAYAKSTAVDKLVSKKSLMNSGIPRVFPSQVSLTGSVKDTGASSHNVKSRSWHRGAPSSSPSHGNLRQPGGSSLHKHSPKKVGRIQSSYIRKGNSLIRNSGNEAPPPRPSHDHGALGRKTKHATARSMTFGIKVDGSDRMIGPNPSFERPKTPPLPAVPSLPSSTNLPKDCPPHSSEDATPEGGVEVQGKLLGSQGSGLLSCNADTHNVVCLQNSEPLNTKRMIYVKRKSNQLIATSEPDFGDSSTHPTKEVQQLSSIASSDLYFRRKKNQLVRSASSSDSQHNRDVTIAVNVSKSDDQGGPKPSSLRSSTAGPFKKRLDKVIRKTYKHSKFSQVWTLNGDHSHKSGVMLHRSKVLPFLFPWKRTMYWKNSASNTALNSNRRSLSLISRKLQLTRKRDTIYTVSTDGFSLRKARVVSIGGSSLKWSKSIERHSKKASEEATLAVAEVERKKRERKRTSFGAHGKLATCLPSKSASGVNLQQGERIFRVGSARYKMDSSKRTLIRILDEEPSHSLGQQSRNDSQTSFVPRRLVIGNDEYVRIGNGNQLVRNPKKLVRILASEKVRWSLHTARLRLAKKQQYCQFFTRFGKCNKITGKCPYIHDPAKVAICTKFLRGVCSDSNCKLTHEIIPERMPDCSYFLQGLCTNENCSYRHVNVNPNAAICDGFLRGYCADGDECRKKHSYVCPVFEATGKCPQGSKCKLHHPKSRNKSKKRKRFSVQSNSSKGRYFGSTIADIQVPLLVSSEKHNVEKGGDAFCSNGWLNDYVSLDDCDNDHDGVEDCVRIGSQLKDGKSDLSGMQPDDLDALIKPVRIMNKGNLTNGSSNMILANSALLAR